MGTLNNDLSFTGSVGNLSAYTMRGHDKVILRTKGGATKRQIQTLDTFESTRNLNNEWKVVVKAAGSIRRGLNGLKALADYNISGHLNALVKKIQVLDLVNPKGKRSILFSRQPDFISSFNYNKQNMFDSLIRQPLSINIDKSSGAADIEIPLLQPSVNFFPHPRYAYFRIVLSMTSVSDYIFDATNSYYGAVRLAIPDYKPIFSAWAPSNIPQAQASFHYTPANNYLPGPDMILILGAGIQYGMPGTDGSMQPVPYVGAARILKCV
ncbi:MAG TPA: hypothetical protein VNW49_03955 [Puia sp.]|jgi:hypothetical protein|nr:hypothetical protein [Puia sp.]